MDIQTAKGIIRAAAMADDTVIMEGPHGVGKSDIVKQVANEDNYHMETLFLSHQDVGDIIGIPHTITIDDESVTTWSAPIWLNRMNDAAWPKEFSINDLDFNDKEFETFVKLRLS